MMFFVQRNVTAVTGKVVVKALRTCSFVFQAGTGYSMSSGGSYHSFQDVVPRTTAPTASFQRMDTPGEAKLCVYSVRPLGDNQPVVFYF